MTRTDKEKAIEQAIEVGFFWASHRLVGKPGEAIQRLPPDVRAILERCTAKDWTHVWQAKKLVGSETSH